MIEFKVKIVSEYFSKKAEKEETPDYFCASSDGGTGNSNIFLGHGKTPYTALRNLIDEFQEAGLYRPE